MRESIRFSGATHVGLVRGNNEDAFFLSEHKDDGFFYCALADGMGGHSSGEIASNLAVSYVKSRLETELIQESQEPVNYTTLLKEVVQKANVKVYLTSLEDEKTLGMGTTLTVLLMDNDFVQIAHVGDCRAYLFRHNQLQQLTTDQTVVQELVEAGSLSPDEIMDHPRRNVLTQALGVPEFLQPEIIEIKKQKHDCYLLCSDGLHGLVSDDKIKEVLTSSEDPTQAVSQLIRLALDRGGEDNITAILIMS